MDFWNYCPTCGKRLAHNEKYCRNCLTRTVFESSDEEFIFTPPIHNIGFFNFQIDFEPYINKNIDYKFDICSCGYLNDASNEFCYHCGIKRVKKGLSKFLTKFKKPKFEITDIVADGHIVCECGAVNDAESEFCEMCGCSLNDNQKTDTTYTNFNLEYDDPVFCVCGVENKSDSQFCSNCGLPLDSYGKLKDIKILCTCSTLNDITSAYCTECGNELEEEVSEIICVCGTRNSPNSKFCSFCERPLNSERILASKIVCSCGKILSFETNFCPSCGKNVKKLINRKRFLFKHTKRVLGRFQ